MRKRMSKKHEDGDGTGFIAGGGVMKSIKYSNTSKMREYLGFLYLL